MGAGALMKKKMQEEKYKQKANELSNQQMEQLSQHLEAFHANLEEFAAKHKQEIRRDPQFRHQFQKMCASIGVDPLASGKGFWSEMLGVGSFYYELGIQAIEVCIATRPVNGGIISIKELRSRLLKTRGKYGQDISIDDIKTSIKKLKLLGTGFSVYGSGDNLIVQSVPSELNMDHTEILEFAQKHKGRVSPSQVMKALSWERERSVTVLEHLVREGMAWIDTQASPKETWYWFPVFFVEQRRASVHIPNEDSQES